MANARDKLNAAIMEAHAKGLRPFCCFGCGDWFAEVLEPVGDPFRKTGSRAPRLGKRGRPRIVCDDLECNRLRRLWTRLGRWPTANERAKPWSARPRKPVKVIYEFGDAA